MTLEEEAFIDRVIDCLPHAPKMRAQIALELRSHIAERVEAGQPLPEVLRQLGDPAALADSYLAAVPLVAGTFLERGFAKIIDVLTFCALVVPLVCYVALGLQRPVLAAFLVPIGALAFWSYVVIAEYRSGQTLGKRLLRLRVVRESGARISEGQAIVRSLPQILQIFWIDVFFALFTERSQRAFELLSKTRVVRTMEDER